MFKHDLEVIDTLRRDAVNVREPHPSGIKKLQAYAAQLAWVGGKFPIDVSMVLCELWTATDERIDWSGILVVSCPGLQHRTSHGPQQPQV